MGLFSKKKESHSIAEAIANKDEDYSYTCASGYSYKFFPSLKQTLYQNIGAVSFDDAFEMYAPNFMATINNMNKNIELLLQQNQQLMQKCQNLEDEVNHLKANSNNDFSRNR